MVPSAPLYTVVAAMSLAPFLGTCRLYCRFMMTLM
jgi:hypothetical protein